MSSRFPKPHFVEYTKVLPALIVVSLAILPTRQFANPANYPPQDTRKIVSDDFTNKRKGNAAEQPRKSETQSRPTRRRTYRLASSSAKRTRTFSLTDAASQLGVTIWRLRPAKSTDSGPRALVREKGKTSEQTPVRVRADSIFGRGDHVRLSIETPREGYLYVVNRDLFSDGTTGGAMLIYPWPEADNHVSPGKLVDIPAQEEDPSYFTANPTSPDQVGELLTIIVTSSPLDLPISDRPFQISNTQLAQWELSWGGQSERFEMEGGAGETWTKQEQEAAAKKATRQLTRDDPAPQTIYRVSTKDQNGFLVNVRLRYVR